MVTSLPDRVLYGDDELELVAIRILAVYHAKWIPDFSRLTDPLFAALNNRKLPLKKPALESIDQVKKHIKEATHVADPNEELVLTSDASSTAIGAILSQENRPVAFMSKRLSKAQKIWSATELEGFAVVEACQQFRHFLRSHTFKIRGDQNGFVQALNSKNLRSIKNRKFAR